MIHAHLIRPRTLTCPLNAVRSLGKRMAKYERDLLLRDVTVSYQLSSPMQSPSMKSDLSM